MDLLNKRFGLRNSLRNTQYHNYEGSVPKDALSQEKEPEFHEIVSKFAKELVDHPDVLLKDEYSRDERVADWNALVKKDMTTFDSRSRTGHKLLDHHMPHFWNVTNPKGKSVASMITHSDLVKALLLNTQMHSTPYKSEIRRTLVMSGGLASVTKYRAGMSKFLVQRYDAKSVLDPCIGWGGRMIGTLAAGASYTGCEPDPNTFRGLQGILEDIQKQATLYNGPAERYVPTLPCASVDMILTSPPYYTLELYTAGDQSVKENMSWETWVSTWLRPLITECLRCLKPNGKSCWSVKNFQSDKKYPLADVTKKIHEDAGWRLVKTVTMTGSARMGSKRLEDGKATRHSEEETFCFQRQV
jgi:hypothetical protein